MAEETIMMDVDDKLDQAVLLLRVFLGLLFASSGWSKVYGLFQGQTGTIEFFSSLGIPLAEVSAWTVGIIELVGGVLLIVGALLSISATLLGIIMVVAMFLTGVIGEFSLRTVVDHMIYIAGLLVVMFKDGHLFSLESIL